MNSFFDLISAFSGFWNKHSYCLPLDSIEKGIRFLSTSSKIFRNRHSHFHLTKILNAFCFFETKIQKESAISPQKRGVCFRLFKFGQEGTDTLGIALAIKIKNQTECLSESQLLRAILHILPGVIPTPHINYRYRDDQTGILYLYLEIEKKRGRGFLPSEIRQLKELLAKELEASIESYTPSLFLVRNEEEIFRNIVQMGRELNKSKDIPQVTISFQEQTIRGLLRFSVVVVRLVNKSTPSLKSLSDNLPANIQFMLEMTSDIGSLDGCSKQANIMTFEVENALFARKNGSIDLREARSYISRALELMIGDFRDYNGGLYSKQNKHLKELQECLSEADKLILESLFYSFSPPLFQTFILPEAGKAFAYLFTEAKRAELTAQEEVLVFKHQEETFSLLILKTVSEHIKSAVVKEIANFSLPLHQFGYTIQSLDGEFYIVLIYQYSNDSALFDSIEKMIQKSDEAPKLEKKWLRINFQEGDPLSLNPHIGLDLRCRALQKAVFEGLTRIGLGGEVLLSGACGVEISDDGKEYLFKLRKLHWTNGKEITAHQYEKSWKKAIISPANLRPDIFYIIKNARQASKGTLSSEEIGVKAINSSTLQVQLEHPAPYFLEMLAHPLFFPLYEEAGEPYIFSGPFTLHAWNRDSSLILTKNPYYWDFENVGLDGIEISMIRDPYLAFQKYEQGELDWIGGPFSLLPLPIASKVESQMQKIESQGAVWIYCNLAHPLFSSAKIRKAFSFALNREKICEKVLLKSTPLNTPIPNKLSLLQLDEQDRSKMAIPLFEEGLKEAGISLKSLDKLQLFHSHIPGQRELAIEIQKQWQQAFGVKIEIVEKTWHAFSHGLDNRQMHFGSCYRHPFYNDPMYFFKIFSEQSNIHNAFGWHSDHFNRCIENFYATGERNFLREAELELVEEMPVIPVHMVSYHYLAKEKVKGIFFNPSGDVDLRWIYLEEK